MNVDDQTLINRTLAGETEAFGQLILQYQDRLYRTLVHLLGSAHDARDVSQEAFLLAFRKLGTFRQESSFYSWLFRIAYHASVSRRRKHKRVHASLDNRRDELGTEPADDSPAADPTLSLDRQEQQQLVRRALNELAPDYREVLILKEFEGLSYEDIAHLLDCPIGTIRSRIHRGREELRLKLTRALEQEGER